MTVSQLLEFVGSLSPLGFVTLGLLALVRGWVVFPREVDAREARIVELVKERDKLLDASLRALSLGERLGRVVEDHDQ